MLDIVRLVSAASALEKILLKFVSKFLLFVSSCGFACLSGCFEYIGTLKEVVK